MIRQNDTHRLIPCKYLHEAESVLTLIAENDAHLHDLFALDHATNDRLWAEGNHLPGLSSDELVYGVPHYRVINAAFTHAHPLGSRFNNSERGAWYAGFEIETSQAEIIFHKTREYAEIGRFDDSVSYDDYLADFQGDFYDIRNTPGFGRVLDPDSYAESQRFAEQLLLGGSWGVIYPSVRNAGGNCIGCFRPASVGNVRKDSRYCFTWSGGPVPEVTCPGNGLFSSVHVPGN